MSAADAGGRRTTSQARILERLRLAAGRGDHAALALALDEMRNEQTERRLRFHPLNAEGIVRAKRILSMLAILANPALFSCRVCVHARARACACMRVLISVTIPYV